MASAPIPFQVSRKLEDTHVAEVFLAEGTETGRQVMVTVIRPESSGPVERVEKFLDQCQKLEGLRHPGLPECLGAGRLADTRPYVVTESSEAQTLRECLDAQGLLTLEQARILGLRMAQALDAAHEGGLLHRGLTPERVRLPEGLARLQPRLMDFGIGLFEGTQQAPYLPPERWSVEEASVQGDVYAVGAILYEGLWGAVPFAASTPEGWVQIHRAHILPPLPDSAGPLGSILRKCLAKLPEERYATAAALVADLERARRPSLQDPTLIPSASSAAAPYPPVHEPLRELGSYAVLSLLGEGSMGQVYQARHTRLGKQVAIKVLKPEHAKNRDLLDRFFLEARTVNQINHEHIVEVHDFVHETAQDGSHRAYCVMELLTGKTLGQLLSEGPICVARILGIARQVCAGLGAAHKIGVVHRDVKPDNIFVTEKSGVPDYVKLLDFGVAKLMSEAPVDHRGTLAGTIIGTPDYMSPEQAAGIGVDARSDIYSLGVVLYEMLTLHRPFSATAFGQLVVDINTKPPPPLPATTPLGEDIPRGVTAVVMRCLEKDPARRPATMEALRQELDGALQRTLEAGASTSAELPSSEDSVDALVEQLRPRHGRRALQALAVLGLLAAVGLVLKARTPGAAAQRPSPPAAPVAAEAPGPLEAELPELLPKAAPAKASAPIPPAEEAKAEAEVPSPVHLRIHSSPPGALVERLDTGERLGVTPVQQSLNRSTALVRFRVSLAGHRPIEKTVRLNEDVALEVELPRAGPPAHPKSVLAKAKSKARAHVKEGKTGVSRNGVIDPYASGL